MTSKVAAYFFLVWDKEEDVNRFLTQEEMEWYRKSAKTFVGATTDLFLQLPDYEGKPDEEIQAFFYEVGKGHFGIQRQELNFWFKCLYTMILGNERGPRLGTLVNLFGIENFLNVLERKMENPF